MGDKTILNIMSQFPPSVDSLDILHYEKYPYIQHNPDFIEDSQHKFLVECDRILKTNYSSKKQHRLGIVGRYLDDSGKDLYKHWYRFMCIDELYREWQQPFFAGNYKNYDDTNSVCINSIEPKLIQYFRDKKIDKILE